MKKIIVLVVILVPVISKSQNIQLHYDFANDRKFYTATFEMFRPDTLGSTFWFMDLDFNFPGSPRSMSAAYLEISRDFYIPYLRRNPAFDQLTLHLEYNDGFTAFEEEDSKLAAATFNNVLLTGFSHPVRIGKIILTTQWLLRIPRDTDSPDFQFTLIWYQPILKGKVLIAGYGDIWSQDKPDANEKEMIFQTEPQLWYMFTPKLGIGSEVEINKNFPFGPEPWRIRPTLAFRWEF
jgi:hypothetical protein